MIQLPMSFKTTKQIYLEEIQCELIEVTHTSTGAQILYLGNDDTENVFNLSFRTTPETSNGIAHILEHTVLCGSKKYPVKDPFFGMTRRSLNTFMNAFTGADFTCYPAASEHEKDFYQLLDVYLDAVFFPLLTKQSFLQEGHRLEFERLHDASSELKYKGIVFNEMKGALASGEARLSEALMEAIFPDITYGINSGGDPKDIPKLTHEELMAFHKTYYHPGRCLFFFYGNIALQKHLDFIEQRVLKQVSSIVALPPIAKQPRFTHSRSVIKHYPLDDDANEQTLIGFGWLTCSILDQLELLALTLLDMILMGTDAGLLKQPLLQSQLCKSVDASLDSEISEVPYFLVFKGCQEGVDTQLKQLIYSTLEQIAKQEIPKELIEGAIHQIEIARTEITGNSYPYGLCLFFRSGLLKQHGGAAEQGLCVHTLFNQLQQLVQSPNFFGQLIHKHFLSNPHFVTVVLNPDETLNKKELDQEKQALDTIKQALDKQATTSLIKQAKELSVLQQQEQSYDNLPKLSLNDIPKAGKDYPLITAATDLCNISYHPCFTNGHLYVDVCFDLPFLQTEQLFWLRLFVWLAPQLGCGGRSYKDNLDYILQHIGGVSINLDLYPQADDPCQLRPTLSLRGKALTRKRTHLLQLLRDMILSIDLTDIARITELLKQHHYDMQLSIQTSALRYAINLAAACYTPGAWISERWFGLHYFWQLDKLVGSFESSFKQNIEKLEEIKQLCFASAPTDLVFSTSEQDFKELQSHAFYGLLDRLCKKQQPWNLSISLDKISSQGRLISSPVAFTALVFPSLAYTHPDAAALSIGAELMENTILHNRIREQGGAYGAGANNSPTSGLFYLYSYRDPHLASTYKAFLEALDKLANGAFQDKDLEEAKFCLFQGLDLPTPPGSRAITTFSRIRAGRHATLRQQFRDRLKHMDRQSVCEAIAKHLKMKRKEALFISFANKEFFDRENTLLKKPLPVEPA